MNKSVRPVVCEAGFYSTSGETVCHECPRGTMCPEIKTSSPIHCTNGTYSNRTASTKCTVCPGGYSCLDPRVTPEICGEGFYSPLKIAQCLICPGGHR